MKREGDGEPSEEQTIVDGTHKEKQTRKIIIPSKTPKKATSLIKKLKLHTTKFDKIQNKCDSSDTPIDISNVKRQTPEGDVDKLVFSKSVSEINLTETSWKSIENLTTPLTTAKNDTDKNLNIEDCDIIIGKIKLPERTKSLENFKEMPAYGDLIVDGPVATTSNATRTGERKDHLYKVLVIGDLGTGKTSIIKRYVHRFFTQHYRATIGVDFALKVLHWDENTLVRLQLWDIAGQERYGNMTRVYYKEAVGAFIVFDVTRVATFESVEKWKKDLDKKVQLADGSPIPCVLLANKCDQSKEGIVNNPVKMDEYCREKQFTSWFETSAKDNINIDEAGRSLVSKILENDALLNAELHKDDDKFSLTEANAQKNKKLCSC